MKTGRAEGAAECWQGEQSSAAGARKEDFGGRMIRILLCGQDFEQEIKPLIKAFFPGAEFEVIKEEWQGGGIQSAARFAEALCARQEVRAGTAAEEPGGTKPGAGLLPFSSEPEKETGAEFLRRPARRGKKTSTEQPCVLDCAFLLYPEEGYLAVQAADGWQAAEFHGVSPEAERKEYRNVMMRKLYRLLAERCGRELPWGMMTGIRPTKQVLERLEAGESPEEVREFMRREYLCSDEKIDVSLAVAGTEHRILEDLDYRSGYSVYIGIPFCPSTCYYCSFPSFPVGIYGELTEAYLNALMREIRYAGSALPGKRLQTLYIGGGTPTTLSAEQLDRLLTCAEESFDLTALRELTVEAGRPDSITAEKLRVIRAHGAGRISINPQTMKQETLDLIGRRHTVEQIRETFLLARELGFDNINMDMILGLAKETPQDVADTLARIGELSPENLTVHTLAVKRAARLCTKKEEYEGLAAENVQEMLRLSCEFAAANNYHPYYLYRQKNMTENLENVGYSRPGREGIYNVLIMEERQTILALGAGATTKFVFDGGNRLERVENVKNLKDYIERIDEMIARKQSFLEQFGAML